MRKIILVVMSIGYILISFPAHSEECGIDRYWINQDINWQYSNTGDPVLDSIPEASTVLSIIFSENGEFRLFSTNGSKYDDTISQHVEIFQLYAGRWKCINQNKIEIEYFLLNRLIKIVGERLDFKPKKEIIEISNSNGIKTFSFLDEIFVVGKNLADDDKERLSEFAAISLSDLKKQYERER